MKTFLYIPAILAILLSMSCASTKSISSSMEDDIYYVPGEKPLLVKEVEKQTGQTIDIESSPEVKDNYSSQDYYSNSATVINRQKGTTEKVSTQELAVRATEQLANAEEIDEIIYDNTGYWIGGFKGNDSDLQEAASIIVRYPDGFGYIANGQDIAMNLSFSPDWNVYTDGGRYWWFPSNTNIELYSSFLFGTYPKQFWTVAWNNPIYDSWAFDSQFNFNFGWGNSGWNFGLGWNSGFNNPWYNGGYNPYWNNPWWGGGYYPGWGHPHWNHPHWNHPHWGGNYPNWGPPSNNRPVRPSYERPNTGSGSTGWRPGSNRPGSATRPNDNLRPGSNRPGSTTRPNDNLRPGTRPDNTVTRPNWNRPGSSTTNPSNNVTRPSNNNARPGTRPGNTTAQPNTSGTRPNVTRPSTTNSNSNRYTRPNTNRNNNQSTNTYRPSYNNNKSNDRSNSYSPSRNTNSYSPSRSGSSSRPSTPPARTSPRPGRR